MEIAELALWWQAHGIFSWLILFVVFLIIELMTMGLTTIWFAGGCIFAFLAGLLGAPLFVQVILFFAASILLLALTKPLVTNYFNKNRVKTNVDSLIGKNAIVQEEINNLEAKGLVTVDGQEWTARAEREEDILPAGTKVEILAIKGVKLIVKEADAADTPGEIKPDKESRNS